MCDGKPRSPLQRGLPLNDAEWSICFRWYVCDAGGVLVWKGALRSSDAEWSEWSEPSGANSDAEWSVCYTERVCMPVCVCSCLRLALGGVSVLKAALHHGALGEQFVATFRHGWHAFLPGTEARHEAFAEAHNSR